jgi:hypothetical protein
LAELKVEMRFNKALVAIKTKREEITASRGSIWNSNWKNQDRGGDGHEDAHEKVQGQGGPHADLLVHVDHVVIEVVEKLVQKGA